MDTALKKLAGRGLARSEGRGWFAAEPSHDIGLVAHPNRTGEPWDRRYRHWRLAVASDKCPLTPTQSAVLWMLASLRGNQSAAGLACLLNISPGTACSAVERLAELGIVTLTRTRGGKTKSEVRWADRMPDGFGSWWNPLDPDDERDAGDAVAIQAVAHVAAEVAPVAPVAAAVEVPADLDAPPPPSRKRANDVLHENYRAAWEFHMAEHRIPDSVQADILREVRKSVQREDLDHIEPGEFVEAAADDHDGSYPHPGHLILDRLVRRYAANQPDAAERAEIREQRHARERDFGPLAELGMVPRYTCSACGDESWHLGGTSHREKPVPPIEIMSGLESAGAAVRIGTPGRPCMRCQKMPPGSWWVEAKLGGAYGYWPLKVDGTKFASLY